MILNSISSCQISLYSALQKILILTFIISSLLTVVFSRLELGDNTFWDDISNRAVEISYIVYMCMNALQIKVCGHTHCIKLYIKSWDIIDFTVI